MNLEQIIDQFIGEELLQDQTIDSPSIGTIWKEGYNQALQDLKSRKQELIDEIVAVIQKKHEYMLFSEKGTFISVDKLIKELTSDK